MSNKEITETEKIIANAILARRVSLNISQEELARLVGSSSGASWTGVVERGKKRISMPVLDALIKSLKTNLPQLLKDHSTLLAESQDQTISREHLDCWNQIVNFDKGQIKILSEVLKIIIKHKNKLILNENDNDLDEMDEESSRFKLARKNRSKSKKANRT